MVNSHRSITFANFSQWKFATYMWRFTCGNLHVEVCIWNFAAGNLQVEFCMWSFAHGSFACEILHMELCMWNFACGILTQNSHGCGFSVVCVLSEITTGWDLQSQLLAVVNFLLKNHMGMVSLLCVFCDV